MRVTCAQWFRLEIIGGRLLQQCEYTASKGVGSQVGNAGNLLKK